MVLSDGSRHIKQWRESDISRPEQAHSDCIPAIPLTKVDKLLLSSKLFYAALRTMFRTR